MLCFAWCFFLAIWFTSIRQLYALARADEVISQSGQTRAGRSSVKEAVGNSLDPKHDQEHFKRRQSNVDIVLPPRLPSASGESENPWMAEQHVLQARHEPSWRNSDFRDIEPNPRSRPSIPRNLLGLRPSNQEDDEDGHPRGRPRPPESVHSIEPVHQQDSPFHSRKDSPSLSSLSGRTQFYSPPGSNSSPSSSPRSFNGFLRHDSEASTDGRTSQSPPDPLGSFTFLPRYSSSPFLFPRPQQLEQQRPRMPSPFQLRHQPPFWPTIRTEMNGRQIVQTRRNSEPHRVAPPLADLTKLRSFKSVQPPKTGALSQSIPSFIRLSSRSTPQRWPRPGRLASAAKSSFSLPRTLASSISELSLKSLYNRRVPASPVGEFMSTKNRESYRVRHNWELDPKEGLLTQKDETKRRARLKHIAMAGHPIRPSSRGSKSVLASKGSVRTSAGKLKTGASERGVVAGTRGAFKRMILKRKDRLQKENWRRDIEDFKQKKHLKNLAKERDAARRYAHALQRIETESPRTVSPDRRQMAFSKFEHSDRAYREAREQVAVTARQPNIPKSRPAREALKSAFGNMKTVGRKINDFNSRLQKDFMKVVKGCCTWKSGAEASSASKSSLDSKISQSISGRTPP